MHPEGMKRAAGIPNSVETSVSKSSTSAPFPYTSGCTPGTRFRPEPWSPFSRNHAAIASNSSANCVGPPPARWRHVRRKRVRSISNVLIWPIGRSLRHASVDRKTPLFFSSIPIRHYSPSPEAGGESQPVRPIGVIYWSGGFAPSFQPIEELFCVISEWLCLEWGRNWTVSFHPRIPDCGPRGSPKDELK